MRSNKNSQGFALVVLAAVIAILGVLLVTMLPSEFERKKDNVVLTTSKQDKITKAIDNYDQVNSLLPCPARYDLAVTDANFGKSDCSNCTTDQVFCSGKFRFGAVPVRTLGLPDNFMFDDWNNRMTYAMSMDGSALTVKDSSGSNVYTAGGNPVTSLVLSHGPDGLGGYNRAGGANSTCSSLTTASTTDSERENCDTDSTFYSAPWNTTTGSTNYNDDIIDIVNKDPFDVTNCTLWLDANDLKTITKDGSNKVSRWKDKCGNGNDAVGFSSRMPTYGSALLNSKPSLSFASRAYLTGNMRITGDTLSVISVQAPTTSWEGYARVIGLVGPTSSPEDFNGGSITVVPTLRVYYGSGATDTRMGGFRAGLPTSYPNTSPVTAGMTAIALAPQVTSSIWNGTNHKFYVNGTQNTNITSASSGDFSTTRYFLGISEMQISGSSDAWNNPISEVIVYNRDLSDTERKELECSLGEKWGITVKGCCPADVAGCEVWLDAQSSDTLNSGTSGTVGSGTKIYTWKDKSGNGHHATGYFGPTYNPTGIGTKPGLTFDGSSSYLSLLNGLPYLYSTGATVFVVAKPTTVSGTRSLVRSDGNYNLFALNAQMRAEIMDSSLTDRQYTSTSNWLVSGTTFLFTNRIAAGGGSPYMYFTSSSKPVTTTGSFVIPGSATDTDIGRSPLYSEYFQGVIGEVVVYPSALSDANRLAVENDIRGRWGI